MEAKLKQLRARIVWVVIGTTALALIFGSSALAAPLASFELREYLGRDWHRTLLTYPVSFQKGQVHEDSVCLTDTEGHPVPCQFWRVERHADGSVAAARLSFMAQLPRQGHYRYDLVPGSPAPAPAAVSATSGSHLTLDNGLVALRLPAEGARPLNLPLCSDLPHIARVRHFGREQSEGLAPGPLQGLRLADGQWVGGSYFWAEHTKDVPQALSMECRITERGPLFVEAQARYVLDNGGYYQCTARVLADDPAIRIDEQFDLHKAGRPKALALVVSLSRAWEKNVWKPDLVYWCAPKNKMAQKDPAFDALLKESGRDAAPQYSGNLGSQALAYNQPIQAVGSVTVRYRWHPAAYYFGLVDSGRLTGEALKKNSAPFIGVVPMHAGNWRGALDDHLNAGLFTHRGDDVAVRWPLIAPPLPRHFHNTSEYDPALSPTYCRRQWALIGGPFLYKELYAFRESEAFVTLDDYKDWVLDWPVDAGVEYPRLLFSAEDVRGLAKRMPAHPGRPTLETLLYFHDDKPARDQLWSKYADGVRRQFDGLLSHGDDDITPWVSWYRQTQQAEWAEYADQLLASKHISPEQRQGLRRDIAALCYLLSEPDVNPRGSLLHLGTPNMPINRFFALPIAAALIADHPQADEWLKMSAEYLHYKLAVNTAPGGAWGELLTYYIAGAYHLIQAAAVLNRTGHLDEPTRRAAAQIGSFPLKLMAPRDPRMGIRYIPNWGHEGWSIHDQWLITAGLVRESDPDLAVDLIWAWDQLGRPLTEQHCSAFNVHEARHADLLNNIAPGYVPKQFQSAWIPGFGAVLRGHAGTSNEVFLAYRQGYLDSHSDGNQGDFVLYAKGAPLLPLSMIQYAIYHEPFSALHKEFGWHNHIRFGQPDNAGGQAQALSQVHAYAFSESADYLRGLYDAPFQRWTRQILYAKAAAETGPDYFVFRDSFFNEPDDAAHVQPAWWYLRTWGAKTNTVCSSDGLQYTSPFGVMLDVRFLKPDQIRSRQREETQEGPIYNHTLEKWRTAGSPLERGNRIRETMTVTAVGPVAPGEDILAVLQPRAAAEPVLRCTNLADGVIRITTRESVDTIFLRRAPFEFAGDSIRFSGVAGMVREYPGEVHLVISEGPGELAFAGVVMRSAAPATRVIPRSELKEAKEIVIPVPESAIRFSLGRSGGTIEEVQPGIRWQRGNDGVGYEFNSADPIVFDEQGVLFEGKRGGIIVDDKQQTVRLVMLEGQRIGYKDVKAWGCAGPYDLTFTEHDITGHYQGRGRFLSASVPPGLQGRAALEVDGLSYAPGMFEHYVIPFLPGKHEFKLQALSQPPIARNWQAW